MRMREKLIEILRVPIYPHEQADPAEVVADYLLDNDVVPVVRCKDCKHGMKARLQPRHAKNYLCKQMWDGGYNEPDHFCSYGKRKHNG